MIDSTGYAILNDFGLVKENMGLGTKTRSLCGTAEYLPQELLLVPRSYGIECDWWSFGCVLYEMICGTPPFYDSDRNQMFTNIKLAELYFEEYHSPNAVDLLTKLLVKDPAKRLSDANVIMSHVFFI